MSFSFFLFNVHHTVSWLNLFWYHHDRRHFIFVFFAISCSFFIGIQCICVYMYIFSTICGSFHVVILLSSSYFFIFSHLKMFFGKFYVIITVVVVIVVAAIFILDEKRKARKFILLIFLPILTNKLNVLSIWLYYACSATSVNLFWCTFFFFLMCMFWLGTTIDHVITFWAHSRNKIRYMGLFICVYLFFFLVIWSHL